MTKKILMTIGMVMFMAHYAIAQTGDISGQVTDAETGDGLVGASVLIEDLERGATTDAEGNFTIAGVPAGTYEFRITFVGYETFTDEVTVTEDEVTTLDVSLDAGDIGLDELVVTGYGVERRREITGSQANVSSRDIQDVSLQNTESLLQGRAAGVNVKTTSGNPGGAFQVNIRGQGSINAATEPLYIVDGVQMSFSQLSGEASTSPLNAINPRDIESIEVLKDAAAASIYGSQAAAGVVIINTARGAEGDTEVSARVERGVRDIANTANYLERDEWLDFAGEGIANNTGLPFEDARAAIRDDIQGIFGTPPGADEGELANTNWAEDHIYTQGVTQNYNLSARGGDESTRFYVSAGYENTEGTAFASEFERINLRTNFDHDVTDRLSATVNTNIARSFQFGVCQDGNFINCPPSQAMFEPPFSFPWADEEETVYNPNTAFGLTTNPVLIENEVDRLVDVLQITGNANLDYRFTDWLTVSGQFGLDFRNTEDNRYENVIARPDEGGWLLNHDRDVTNFNTNLVANMDYTFDEVHNLSGRFGTEYRRDHSSRVTVRGDGFPGTFFDVLDASSDPTTASGTESEFRIGSFFGRAQYNYDDRYFLNFTARYDGHSRFGEDTRWGFFPSISGSWNIAQEEFFTYDVVDDLRLRASYGITGNAAIGNFAARGLYSVVGSYSGGSAMTPTQLENPQLSWEEAEEVNLGLDYSFGRGRISGSLDVYRRNNNELLFDRPLPAHGGYDDITENIGSVRNEGIEFEISSVNVNTPDFQWSTRYNIGFIRNEVTELPDGETIDPTATLSRIEEGEPLGQINTPEWAGVNPADGRPMWYDADGNLTFTPSEPDDNVQWNDGVANQVGGIGNNFDYRGVQLDIFFEFSFGQWAFANTDWYFTRTPSMLGNLDEMVLDRWQEEGDVTYFPRAHFDGADFPETADFRTQQGTHAMYNASYIRLKDITLSYNMPLAVTETLGIRNLRVFATGLNLALWTAWPFYDPEVATDTDDIFQNITVASYPTEQQFNVGIEVDF